MLVWRGQCCSLSGFKTSLTDSGGDTILEWIMESCLHMASLSIDSSGNDAVK